MKDIWLNKSGYHETYAFSGKVRKKLQNKNVWKISKAIAIEKHKYIDPSFDKTSMKEDRKRGQLVDVHWKSSVWKSSWPSSSCRINRWTSKYSFATRFTSLRNETLRWNLNDIWTFDKRRCSTLMIKQCKIGRTRIFVARWIVLVQTYRYIYISDKPEEISE